MCGFKYTHANSRVQAKSSLKENKEYTKYLIMSFLRLIEWQKSFHELFLKFSQCQLSLFLRAISVLAQALIGMVTSFFSIIVYPRLQTVSENEFYMN